MFYYFMDMVYLYCVDFKTIMVNLWTTYQFIMVNVWKMRIYDIC